MKIFMKYIGLVFGMCLVIILKCSAQVSANKIPLGAAQAISENNRLYFKAFENNDRALFTDRYTEDCWIMTDGIPSLCGPQSPAYFYQVAYGQMGWRTGKKITSALFPITGDLIAETGSYVLINADNKIIANGKYIVLWKNTAQGWKIFRESFNRN